MNSIFVKTIIMERKDYTGGKNFFQWVLAQKKLAAGGVIILPLLALVMGFPLEALILSSMTIITFVMLVSQYRKLKRGFRE